MQSVLPVLAAAGAEITSRWIFDDTAVQSEPLGAQIDLDDIVAADALVLFTDQFGHSPGKGKYVEFGYAYGLRKRIILVGENDGCVFYRLPGITRVGDIDRLVKLLVDNQPPPTVRYNT